MHIALPNIQSAWDKAVPFQVEDAEFASKNGSVVLGHETGLGKTFISLLAWSQWPNAQKALILGTLGSMSTWNRVLTQFGGTKPLFIQGISDSQWNGFLEAKQGVFMCTYATYHLNMKRVTRGKPRVDLLINDELHKVLRHRNEYWKAIKRLEFRNYIGASATWASRGPQDLYPVLNLANHRTFSSYWRFVNTWCYVEKTEGFGTQIYGVKNEANLRKLLWSQYYRARTWKEVGNQLRPGNKNTDELVPVIRRAEEVQMGKQQIKLIRDLDRDMIVLLGKDMIVTPNSLSLLTRKLQMAISPKILFPNAEYGGPIEWLLEKVEEDPHVVIFCPFREGLDVMRQALIDKKYPANRIFILRGGVHPDEIDRLTAEWKKCRGVMLCTTAFAQSFALDSTNNAYSLGFLWDPNDNYQAEGRLRRFDSILQTPCNMTYIVPLGSDYHNVMDVLDGKVISTHGYLKGYKPTDKYDF